MSLPTLIILWVIYCTLHSGLIAVSTSRVMRRLLGERFRWYRLGYNVFSLITVVPLLFATSKVPGDPVFAWEGWLRVPQYLLLALAVLIFVAGGRGYDLSRFAGIDHLLRSKADATPPSNAPVLSAGLHGLIRHPWYTGVFIFIWAHDMNTTTLAVNIVLSGYIVIGTLLEEHKLVLEFGQVYRDYRQQVSMFVPWKWLMSSLKPKHSC